MKNKYLAIGLSLALMSLMSGCETYSAQRVTTSQLRATTGIDPADVADVSAQMATSLISENLLKKSGGRTVIELSTFRNNTALYDFDPALIFNRVKVTLNRSGVAYCYVKNDQVVNTERDIQNFLGEGNQRSARYTLTLELVEQHASMGRTTQNAYQVHMTLNDKNQGIAVWEDIQDVVKVGRRSAVGF